MVPNQAENPLNIPGNISETTAYQVYVVVRWLSPLADLILEREQTGQTKRSFFEMPLHKFEFSDLHERVVIRDRSVLNSHMAFVRQ